MDAFFHTFAQSTDDIIICLSRDYKISYLNQPAQHLFQKSSDKLINNNFITLCQQNKMESLFPSNIDKLLHEKQSIKKEITIQKNGLNQNVTWTIYRISDKKNNGFMLIGVYNKSTQFNDLDTSLIDVISQIPISIYCKDKNGIYLDCNNYVAQIAGFKNKKNMIGKTDYDMPWKDNADKLKATDTKIMKTNKMLTLEETVQIADGSIQTYLSNKAPLKNRNGYIIGITGVSFNITKLKNIEENQQKTLDYMEIVMENLISNVPISIYWKNKDGLYMGCNKYVLTMAGVKNRQDIIGKTDEELPWKKSTEDIRNIDQKVIHTGIPYSLEETGKLADGTNSYVISNKLPLKDKNGKIIGVMGISVDITDRKEAERKLKEAKEKAEIASRMKTEFLQNMGHDLRTPLSGILGSSKFLKANTHDEKNKKIITDLSKSATKLLGLINDIIDMTKLEFSESKPKEEPFNIRSLINDITGLMKSQAFCKNLDLIVDCPDEIPTYVEGDRSRVHRILLNLVSNALKFTHQGYIKIGVEIIKKDSEKCELQIYVEDTGIGISKDKYETIFERFSRLSPSYKGGQEGIGLGLSIAKKMINEIGGSIKVESQVGRGATFFCNLPFKLCDDKTLEKQEKKIKKKSKLKIKNISPISKVLLIEDDQICKRVTTMALEDMGFNIDTASSGKEVREQVKKQHYDLILMDVGLPDSDGFTLTKEIRNNAGKNQKTLIIVLSGHLLNEQREEYLDGGVDEILQKPLDEQVLMQFLASKTL